MGGFFLKPIGHNLWKIEKSFQSQTVFRKQNRDKEFKNFAGL